MGILDERKVKRIEVGIPSDISARDEETLYIGATEDSGIALGSTTVVPSNSNNNQRIVDINSFSAQLSSIEGKYDAVEGKYNNVSSQLSSTETKYNNVVNYLGGNIASDMFSVKILNATDILNGKLVPAGSYYSHTIKDVYSATSMNSSKWIAVCVAGWYIRNITSLDLPRCYLSGGSLSCTFANKKNSDFTFSNSDTSVTFRILFVRRSAVPSKSSSEF